MRPPRVGRRRLVFVLLLALAALAASPEVAEAQSCAVQSGRIRLRVKPQELKFPNPGSTDFNTGFIESRMFRVAVDRVEKNEAWTLCIRAEDPTMGGGKDIADLQWQVVGTSTWTSFTTFDQFVAAGIGKKKNLTLRFRVLLDWTTDAPGTYIGRATYLGTVTAN